MSVKVKHHLNAQTWLITFTCYNWISLFEITDSYDLVYNWLKVVREKYNIDTLAFVIMPNHVHAILYIPDEALNLNTLVGNGKRFIAYELIKRLNERNAGEMLKTLADACTVQEKAKKQLHKVFEASFDAKPIFTIKFWEQKLNYIHNNPVNGKWNLADDFINYPHSSAAFYVNGTLHPNVKLTNFYSKWDE